MPTNPTLNDLCALAAVHGVTVHKAHLEHGTLGFYSPQEARIYLAIDLTPAETRSTLAHELGHVYYGHTVASARNERQAWMTAAALLIDPAEYASLEREGHAVHEIAEHMNVTGDVVSAFHDHHLQRIGDRTYGRRWRGRLSDPLARALA